jgi:hypothetical protein
MINRNYYLIEISYLDDKTKSERTARFAFYTTRSSAINHAEELINTKKSYGYKVLKSEVLVVESARVIETLKPIEIRK